MVQNKGPENRDYEWSRGGIMLAVAMTAILYHELIRTDYAIFAPITLMVASAIIGYNNSRRW